MAKAAKKSAARKSAAKKSSKQKAKPAKVTGPTEPPTDAPEPASTGAAEVPGTPRAKAGPPATASAAPSPTTPTVLRNGFVRLTRAGAPESRPVYVNVANIVLVEPTLPLPGLVTPPEAGATVHLMGQPTWPLFVQESVDAVLAALAAV